MHGRWTGDRRVTAVYRSELVCDVRGMAYDFDRHLGTLLLASEDCCDMRGCIELFEKVDPEVQRIEIFAGEEWQAVQPESQKEYG